jgi:hypothetical protein
MLMIISARPPKVAPVAEECVMELRLFGPRQGGMRRDEAWNCMRGLGEQFM